MHDIKWIRDHPEQFDAALRLRGLEPLSHSLIDLDAARRGVQTELQALQQKRNDCSKLIGLAKKDKDDARAEALMAEVASIKADIQTGEERERTLVSQLDDALMQIPNMPDADVPHGADENDNVEIKRWGERPQFDFEPQLHDDLAVGRSYLDFEAAAKLSGARFCVLKGPLARLERALGQFMVDTQVADYGYTEINPPVLVRDDAMFGTAQLPKFRDDQFGTTNGFWLIPTAEVPLTNLVREQILDESQLPLRFTAESLCFRAEAGAAGRDTRGLIRQHQFKKVEMVAITTAENSVAEHERMLAAAENILQKLGLHYRVVTLCTGDMGFGAAKTYDIEVWLPGQDTFREISSVSNCRDFQARRMKARYRNAAGQISFVHTLNGSGLAVGRTLVAVLENYQQRDGSVRVPDALRPYMGGLEIITP